MGILRHLRNMSAMPVVDSPRTTSSTLPTTPKRITREPSTRPATLANPSTVFSHAHEEHLPAAKDAAPESEKSKRFEIA